MRKAVILSAKRTPIGSNMGIFNNVKASLLAASAFSGVLNAIRFPSAKIEDVILGQAIPAGNGQHLCKQAAFYSKIPETVPCMNVNVGIASGIASVITAAKRIQTGYRKVVLCGGAESMSKIPHFTYIRKPVASHNFLIDLIPHDGFSEFITGETGEEILDKLNARFGYEKEQFEAIKVKSFENAIKAKKSRLLEREISGFNGSIEERSVIYDEELDARKSKKTQHGIKYGDGAQGILLASDEYAMEAGLFPKARIITFEEISGPVTEFPLSAIHALQKAMKGVSMKETDINYFEIDETYPITLLLAEKMLKIPQEKINIHGGCSAFGTPLGYIDFTDH